VSATSLVHPWPFSLSGYSTGFAKRETEGFGSYTKRSAGQNPSRGARLCTEERCACAHRDRRLASIPVDNSGAGRLRTAYLLLYAQHVLRECPTSCRGDPHLVNTAERESALSFRFVGRETRIPIPSWLSSHFLSYDPSIGKPYRTVSRKHRPDRSLCRSIGVEFYFSF
jgi:hypothetical protein